MVTILKSPSDFDDLSICSSSGKRSIKRSQTCWQRKFQGRVNLLWNNCRTFQRGRREIVSSGRQVAPLAQLYGRLEGRNAAQLGVRVHGADFKQSYLSRTHRKFPPDIRSSVARAEGNEPRIHGKETSVPFSSSELGQRKQRRMPRIVSRCSGRAVKCWG